ncbi:hypothetical protein B484DRAFT_421070 [Ochromonadaceae sp. CCMP2298]|nr:hypothetical protein B484DRAFT_421070 [Ochromonadaceae sp. CCMP2298]
MSERWYAKSAFFRSEAASYRDSVLQSDRLHGKLQTLQFLNHTPILCWLEKGFMVFDFLQLFALMWIMAQPWPWPYLWSAYTRPVVYVNADVFSTTVHGALAGSSTSEYSDWGSMDNYLPYALLFAAIQCLAFWSIILLRQGRDVYGIITPDNKHSIIAFLTVFSYVAYLPCSLATFRLYYCEDRGGSVLAADPTVQCAGPTHITFLLICSFCTLPVFFGFPYMIFKYIQRTVVYGDSCDHEKRLQIWEILHMLGLDDYWVKRQFWISSSFTKFGVFYRFNMLLLKAFYLLIFVFLRFNLLLQSVVCTLATCAFSSYYGLGFVVSWTNMPFRNKLSNMISLCCYSMLITASTFGMVNSFGVENAITVGSTQSLVMFAFHTCFVVCILLLLAATLVRSLRLPDWPSAHTMNHIWHNKELLPKAAKWVESIRDAMIIRADFLMAPVEVADINSLEEVIRVLRGNWLSARSVGSLFEVPIGELLEELLYIHAKRYPAALRKVPCWDAAYADEEVRGVLALRHGDRAMMAPAKKRVMMKLLAIRFMRGDRGEFSMDFD